MKAFFYIALLAVSAAFPVAMRAQSPTSRIVGHPATRRFYTGFDRNDYPGDDLLPALHRSFAFTGYWLNNPPGRNANPWTGKRRLLRLTGFGFAVLFNGRLYAGLQGQDAVALGRQDAVGAIAAAHREGFPTRTVIFLDQEEGGHLLTEQAAYLYTWVDAMGRSPYKAGVYCSGIGVGADSASTAEDIRQHFRSSQAGTTGVHPPALWVANDRCPPAPGCTLPAKPPAPATGETTEAPIWQYAQSPRRPQFTAGCAATYSADGRCYAPAPVAPSPRTAIDLDTSASPDPSNGR